MESSFFEEMKKNYLLFLVVISFFKGYGQFVVSSSGSSFINSNIKLDYTLGEVLISTLDNNGYLVTQGFHQTSWSILSSNNILKEVDIKIFPNPTSDYLNVCSDISSVILVEIFNVNGQKFFKSSENASHTIDVSSFSKGIYIINIYRQNQLIKTVKLLKS